MLAHGRLSELADDNSKNQEDQNCDDGDGDYLIRSHSEKSQPNVVGQVLLVGERESALPTSHLLQCLVASVGVALTLKEHVSRVLNDLSLSGQVGKSIATNVFSFESDALTFA